MCMKIKLNKIGLITASTHFLIVIYFISETNQNDLVWIWMILSIIDFPISELSIIESAYLYLILGSIWWYFIPIILQYLFNLLGKLLDQHNENKNT